MTSDPEGQQAVRVAVSLPPEVGEQLEHLTATRFGKRSLAVAAAVRIATEVFGDVSTFGVADPLDALEAYVKARE